MVTGNPTTWDFIVVLVTQTAKHPPGGFQAVSKPSCSQLMSLGEVGPLAVPLPLSLGYRRKERKPTLPFPFGFNMAEIRHHVKRWLGFSQRDLVAEAET
ncbi:hypothetical protein NQZ68_033967 [Dissostichus eleginoides]|nr:hypothetical protein NQZ68_033967 [Dissostichus eleginoides]